MKIDHLAFYEGSFTDEKVINVQYNERIKNLTFTVKGAQTENSQGKIILYQDINFEISNWWELNIFYVDPNTQNESALAWNNDDFLDEILIYNISNGVLTLEGFGKTSMKWKKFIFLKASVVLSVQ